MASNFQILVHRNSENLHVKLLGDFDGSSAHQLINTLKSNSHDALCIFIHTSNLRQVHPFGRDMFQSNLHQLNNKFFGSIVYTGKHAPEIAPENSRLM